MAPKWPKVNDGPEHINEHATYLREACNQLQAVDKGRQNQVPWNIVQPYLTSTITLIGKVLRQPAISEILHHIQDAAKCTQSIQRDVTVIKNSVGLNTAPLGAANFSGVRAAGTTWAQVAAQSRGSTLIPPPVPQGMRATKAQSTVTAYKDRAVIVKLKDHGIAQRLRTLSAAELRQQIEASIRNSEATKGVKIVAAHQLKSGDIQIYTASTAEAEKLREHRGWIRGLGEHAELIVPTYGVIVHGISTNSINIKDQTATIQQMLADNHTVIPKAEISFVGWLTKESPLKRASSIVVEFTNPEMANAIIYAGMVWHGQIHVCQLYDRACRVKQCFRCYNYGHIGTQCDASQTCGYCAELHETKNCRQKGVDGFTPRCTVCKGAHTAWSNACPARRKEVGRVEQAKQIRSIYWNVISKVDDPENNNGPTGARPARNGIAKRTIQIPDNPIRETSLQPATTSIPPRALEIDATPETQASPEDIAMPISADQSAAEDWATPATQQEPTPTTNPPVPAREQPFPHGQAISGTFNDESMEAMLGNAESLPTSLYPLDEVNEEFDIHDADAWLANLESNSANDWLHDTVETARSPPTSLATDTRTAHGTIYKGCKCPSHQEIYSNWPTQDAELTIAQCMKTCVYCGSDFNVAADLRKHLKRLKYARRNISICQGIFSKHVSDTPAWTPKETSTHRSGSEPFTLPSNLRITRSQSFTNGTNGARP